MHGLNKRLDKSEDNQWSQRQVRRQQTLRYEQADKYVRQLGHRKKNCMFTVCNYNCSKIEENMKQIVFEEMPESYSKFI